jgi:hypothetical protein
VKLVEYGDDFGGVGGRRRVGEEAATVVIYPVVRERAASDGVQADETAAS